MKPVACLLGFAPVFLGMIALAPSAEDPFESVEAFAWRPPEQPDQPYLPPPYPRRTSPPPSPEFLRVGSYQSVQVNVDANGQNIVGDAANEPTIAVDPNDHNRIVIGWRQFDTINSNFRQAGWAYSHDHGRHWTFAGVIEPGVFRSDPVLDVDTDGNFYFDSLTSSGGSYWCHVFKSTDGGVTWHPGVYAYGGDKEWMIVDRTNSTGRNHIYSCWSPSYSSVPGTSFTRSIDRGASFQYPIAVTGNPYWGTMAVDREGALYLCGTIGSQFRVAKSTNARNPAVTPTWDFSVTVSLGGSLIYGGSPNPGGLMGQAWIATGPRPDGGGPDYVYLLCSVDPPGSDPLDVRFARSVDGGLTWSPSIRINDDPPETNAWQWFGTMSVAPNGRIDVIWNDTRDQPSYRWSRVYYSYSTDGGLTWSANVPLTPAWDSLIGWPQQNKIGDYYHMRSDNVGADLAYAATFNGEQDVYYLRIGDYDCNNNGIGDSTDISSGASSDLNGNSIPDECEGLGDLNCDESTNAFDIDPFVLALTDPDAYQNAYPGCRLSRADINGDGQVNAFDIDPFVTLLTWAD